MASTSSAATTGSTSTATPGERMTSENNKDLGSHPLLPPPSPPLPSDSFPNFTFPPPLQLYDQVQSQTSFPLAFSPPLFSEPPVSRWLDCGVSYPTDIWSANEGMVGVGPTTQETSVAGPNADGTSALSSRVFPLTLDVSGCLRELQKKQQQWASHGRDGRRSHRSIVRQRSSGGGGGIHHQQLNRSSSANSVSSRASSSSSFSIDKPALPTENMKLKFILQKELTSTDVSAVGRIILPKKEAEANLPFLVTKEGILIIVRDAFSSDVWKMRYRFWPNDRSRMYVLEHTGDFIRKNNLKCGDFIAIYRDDKKQNFIYAKKAGKRAFPVELAVHEERERGRE